MAKEAEKARFEKRWGFSRDDYERSLEAQAARKVAEENAAARSQTPHLDGFLGWLKRVLDAWVASW
jgi:hypothetical protein